MEKANILIVFDSKTGNVKKMATAVAEGAREVANTNVTIKTATETTNDDLLKADCIIIGSPTYYGLMSARVKDLFDSSVKIHGKLAGKVGAAFTSAGGKATGAESTLLSILEAMLVHGMIVQGRSDDKHYGAACELCPDDEANKICRELGKRTAELSVRLKSANAK